MSRDRSALPHLVRPGILLVLLTSFCFSPALWAAESAYAPDQLIVQYKVGKAPKDTTLLNAQYGVKKTERVFKLLETLGQQQGKSVLSTQEFLAQVRARYPMRAQRAPATTSQPQRLEDIYLLRLRPGADVRQALADYRSHAAVSFAEPNYQYQLTFTPNDPFWQLSDSWDQGYADLWGLRQIKMEQAWDLAPSAGQGIKIAIVDSGVDCTHPDLANACDLANAWNALNNTSNAMDDNGHGTHVAGIAAARGNNGKGIVGVAYQSTVLPIKVAGPSIFVNMDDVAEGITYAVSGGADVINLSLGGSWSAAMEAAFDTAENAGAISVAAAGNDGDDMLDYPASSPRTIAVGATTHVDKVATWSNHTQSVTQSRDAHHVVAPGGDNLVAVPNVIQPWNNILSLLSSTMDDSFQARTVPNGIDGAYGRIAGTSMAAPYVSGVVALLLTQNSTLPLLSVTDILELSADDIELVGPDPTAGFGRINAQRALTVGALLLDKGPNN